jgi:hypothetical protein
MCNAIFAWQEEGRSGESPTSPLKGKDENPRSSLAIFQTTLNMLMWVGIALLL